MTNVNNIKLGGKDILFVMKAGNIIWPEYDIATIEVLKYADRMGYQKASRSYIDKLDSFIKELKQEGLWNKFDVLYWMQGDGDMNFKTINIVNPALSGTPIGGLSSSLQGIKGNQIDGYIDTNYNSSNAVKQEADNASIAFMISELGNVRISGNVSGVIFTAIYANDIASRLNCAQNPIGNPDLAGSGYKVLTRVGDALIAYNNGIVTEASTSSSNAISPENIIVFRNAAGYGSSQLSMYSIGSALSLQDSANLRQAILDNL